MHIISKKDVNSAELETLTTSKSPTTVITAKWWSADEWRGHSLCQRIGFVLDNESPRGDASSFIARKALRWTRVLIRVDQRSKSTSHWKRYSDTVQHGELRSDRGSWFINEFFLKFASSTSMTPSRQEIDHPTSSSSSCASPTMTSSSVSSESVAGQERGDLWDRSPSRSCVK